RERAALAMGGGEFRVAVAHRSFLPNSPRSSQLLPQLEYIRGQGHDKTQAARKHAASGQPLPDAKKTRGPARGRARYARRRRAARSQVSTNQAARPRPAMTTAPISSRTSRLGSMRRAMPDDRTPRPNPP